MCLKWTFSTLPKGKILERGSLTPSGTWVVLGSREGSESSGTRDELGEAGFCLGDSGKGRVSQQVFQGARPPPHRREVKSLTPTSKTTPERVRRAEVRRGEHAALCHLVPRQLHLVSAPPLEGGGLLNAGGQFCKRSIQLAQHHFLVPLKNLCLKF